MTDTLNDMAANKDAGEEELDQQQLAQRLLAQAKEQGVELVLEPKTQITTRQVEGGGWSTAAADLSGCPSEVIASTRSAPTVPLPCS